ncbi:MAG: PTS transporter subunit EIIC [Lachnospiraceae bacterium]
MHATVVAGVHHMCNPSLTLDRSPASALLYWLPLASAANVAQGGAALAVGLKSKNQKIKSMAVPSALSACMGITEPAIFGVNLRFGKPFIMGCLGGCMRSAFASITRSPVAPPGTGVTGIFGILLCLNNPVALYPGVLHIAFELAFVLTWMIGYKRRGCRKQLKKYRNRENRKRSTAETVEEKQRQPTLAHRPYWPA